jgi:hypothetical protein
MNGHRIRFQMFFHINYYVAGSQLFQRQIRWNTKVPSVDGADSLAECEGVFISREYFPAVLRCFHQYTYFPGDVGFGIT